jgi:hypothetical protein
LQVHRHCRLHNRPRTFQAEYPEFMPALNGLPCRENHSTWQIQEMRYSVTTLKEAMSP